MYICDLQCKLTYYNFLGVAVCICYAIIVLPQDAKTVLASSVAWITRLPRNSGRTFAICILTESLFLRYQNSIHKRPADAPALHSIHTIHGRQQVERGLVSSQRQVSAVFLTFVHGFWVIVGRLEHDVLHLFVDGFKTVGKISSQLTQSKGCLMNHVKNYILIDIP